MRNRLLLPLLLSCATLVACGNETTGRAGTSQAAAPDSTAAGGQGQLAGASQILTSDEIKDIRSEAHKTLSNDSSEADSPAPFNAPKREETNAGSVH